LRNILQSWRKTFLSDSTRDCDTVCPGPHVRSATIDGRCVLLDLRKGQYYGLDEVGTLIWQCIQRRASRAEIIAELTITYEVAADVVTADTARFVQELLQRRLAVRV
jgi:hypothetical protein